MMRNQAKPGQLEDNLDTGVINKRYTIQPRLESPARHEVNYMSIPSAIDNMLRYVSEAVGRIFGPSDDKYPNIGIQPFEGEPFDKKNHRAD